MSINYKKLLENSSSWIWEIDINHAYTSCSDGVYDFLGVDADSLIGEYFCLYMNKEEQRKLQKAYIYSLVHKTPIIDFPVKYFHKNTLEFSVLLNAVPVLDKNGEVCSFEGFNRKISYDKILEEEKTLSEERLELIRRANNDGIWDWNILDNSVYFDKRWKEIIGFEEDELKNTIENWAERVHPDDLQETWNSVEKNVNSNNEYYEGIHRLKHKNGEWVWILDRGKTLYDENGKAIRMIGTHTDITNEKIEQLKVIHQRQIIEEIHDSVISTDLDGKIIGWNSGSEVLLGYSTAEAMGKHISMIYIEEELPSLENNIELLMKNAKTYSVVHLITQSKEILTCNLSLSLLRDENSVPIGMVGYTQDVTDIKKAEDALTKQARMVQMGEMLSMIAHQWRQPLNAITLTSANLRLKFEFDEYKLKHFKEFNQCKEEFEQGLENIEEYVSILSTTINDFKNFYATDKKYTSVKLENVISKSMDIIGISFSKNGVNVIKEYNSNEYIKVYENELMQVILNILKNAEDNFLEKNIINPSITIKIEDKKIFICDNGGGIKPEIIEKIFDPYFSTKSDKNGTGLGLYLSKIIVEEHHKGKISVHNRDDGVCFVLEFV